MQDLFGGLEKTDAEAQRTQAENTLSKAKLAALDRMMETDVQTSHQMRQPSGSGAQMQRFLEDSQQCAQQQPEQLHDPAAPGPRAHMQQRQPLHQHHPSPDAQSAQLQASAASDAEHSGFEEDASHSTPDPPVMSKAEEIRFNAAKKQELAQARNAVDAMDAQIDAEKHRTMAHMGVMRAKNKENCLDILKTALGVDLTAQAQLSRKSRKRGMASLVFCLVIIGIELDLLGFMCAFPHYWNLTTCNGTNVSAEDVEQEGCSNILVLRMLLICMPCAYMFCVLTYMFILDPIGWTPELPLQDDGIRLEVPNISSQYLPESMQQLGQAVVPSQATANESKAKALEMRVKAPVQLTWVHFLPLLRFMLVMKSIDENDIEGVFRVNSLSSFTLGSAQVMGMLFTFMNFDGNFAEMNMFVYVNIFSQFVNWAITVVYFATPVAKTLANSITVDAYTRNVEMKIEDELLQLVYDMEQNAHKTAEHEFAQADDIALVDHAFPEGEWRRKAVEWEIKMMKNISVPLDAFNPTEILSIRRVLLQHWGQEFANC